jgi:hypothetical protein
MPAKQAAAVEEPTPKRKMTKAEACKALHVASMADEDIVTQAYWHLTRKYKADAKRNPEARERLADLNEAFALLLPAAAAAEKVNGSPPPPVVLVQPEPEPANGDEMMGWLRQLPRQIAERWPGRGTEIAALTASVGLLAVLAYTSGASQVLTLLGLGVALVVIIAPWRKA